MRRLFWLSGFFALVMGFLGTLLALTVALPAVVDAQANRLRAEQLTIVGDNGTDRIRLQTGPGLRASTNVLDANGQSRVELTTGGTAAGGGVTLEGAGVNVLASNGVQIGRLGTNPDGTGATLRLQDREGRARFRLALAEDGMPSMQMLAVDDTVIWSAP
jgi:hypothetical protein